MKILSISDVITNSSSEVFCTITADNKEILEEIYNTIENFRLFVDTYLPSLTIRIFKEWEKKNNEVGRTF